MFKNAYTVTSDEVEIHWSKDVGTFWTHIAIVHGFFFKPLCFSPAVVFQVIMVSLEQISCAAASV